MNCDKLGTAEEVPNHRAERLRIDQLLRRHAVDVDVEQSHALFDETFRPSETDAALIGEQFADRPHAAAAEMIDIVERAFAAAQIDQVLDRSDEILVGDNALAEIDVDPELLVDLVATNAAEIVFLRIEEETLQEGFCIRDRRRIARAQFPVNILQRLFLIVRWIFLQRFHDGVVI